MLQFPNSSRKSERGLTLLELVVAATLVAVLSLMVLPMAKLVVQREKEKQLRHALWEMRDAIDRYKDHADRDWFQVKADSVGYPPDLETLVKGVSSRDGVRLKYLRRIPVDPMTNSTDWGLRSNQDDLDSDAWGGQAVFDVYTKSEKTALDGTKYKDW